MDYGKFSLLEQTLEPQKEQQISKASFIFNQRISPATEIDLCQISGKGRVALIISVNFKEGFSVYGGDSLRADGQPIFAKPHALTQLFMASLDTDKTVKITLFCDGARWIDSAEIMVMGGQIVGTPMGEVSFVTDENNKTSAAVVEVEGEIRLSTAHQALPDFDFYNVAGFGFCPIVVALEYKNSPAFAVIFLDKSNFVFITITDQNGGLLCCQGLGFAAKKISAVYSGGQLIVGYCQRGYAYAAVLTLPDFRTDYIQQIDEAAGIDFVRDCLPPAIILDKKTGYVIRLPQDEIPSTDSISIKTVCEV